MSKQKNTDVLIVGAGPTGLMLASELLKYGIDYIIIDKNSEPSKTSKALAVQVRTLEIFESIDIVEKALDTGMKMPEANLFINKEHVATLTFKGVESPYPQPLMLEQNKTEELLESKLDNSKYKVQRNTELLNFSQNDNGIEATVKSNNKEEVISAKYIVGCDGAHSKVRHVLNMPFEGSKYEDNFINADVKIDWELPHWKAYFFISENGLIVTMPMREENKFRIIALRQNDSDEEPTLQEFQDLMDKFTNIKTRLYDPDWLVKYTLHRRIVPYLRNKNAFLAGDAAHIHSPAGGQGMNTGIQDSFNLAWKLAYVIKGVSDKSLLDSYNEERLPVIQEIVKFTDIAFKTALSNNKIVNNLRKKIAPLAINSKLISQKMTRKVSQIDYNYRHSSFVNNGNSTSKLKPGDRVPDSTLYYPSLEKLIPVRLFELLKGTKFKLLLLGGLEQNGAEQRLLEQIGNVFIKENFVDTYMIFCDTPLLPANWEGNLLIDASRELHLKFKSKNASVFLIRPDNYFSFVGSASDKEILFDNIDKYFIQA